MWINFVAGMLTTSSEDVGAYSGNRTINTPEVSPRRTGASLTAAEGSTGDASPARPRVVRAPSVAQIAVKMAQWPDLPTSARANISPSWAAASGPADAGGPWGTQPSAQLSTASPAPLAGFPPGTPPSPGVDGSGPSPFGWALGEVVGRGPLQSGEDEFTVLAADGADSARGAPAEHEHMGCPREHAYGAALPSPSVSGHATAHGETQGNTPGNPEDLFADIGPVHPPAKGPPMVPR